MFDLFKRNKECDTEDKVARNKLEDYIDVLFNSAKIPEEKRKEGLFVYGWIINDGAWT
jgi:hypothetical protein